MLKSHNLKEEIQELQDFGQYQSLWYKTGIEDGKFLLPFLSPLLKA